MIQTVPLDLPLLTACTDTPIVDFGEHEQQAYQTFAQYRDQLESFNARLSQNLAVSACLLRIPLTEALANRLHLFWLTVPYAQLRLLRIVVMALLSNRTQRQDLTVWLDDAQVAQHAYQLAGGNSDGCNDDISPHFFPASLPVALCNAWVETLGACAFECGVAASRVSPVQIGTVWVVSDRVVSPEMVLRRTPILSPESVPEECIVPLLARPDDWAWERMVRRTLWKDERLPFNGPRGPFGYCPPDGWHPGERPRRYQNAYPDTLGGLWEWESGRAVSQENPFRGHWNVQLPDASIRRRWVNWIETRSERAVQTRVDLVSHINIEPDGCIGDLTFKWDD